MRFVTYSNGETARPGLLLGEERKILDLTKVLPKIDSLNSLICDQWDVLARLHEYLVPSPVPDGAIIPASSVKILAPIPQPLRNIICVGKNYFDHAREFHGSGFDASAGSDAIPDHPIFFTKSATTVIGPGAAIPASADWTHSVDYEVELGVVIAKGGRAISKSQAYDHVFGYTIINDVTSRTLQQQHKQWFLGKNFDGFCPMGPQLVTADEVGDINELTLTTHVNDELRQNAKVKDLIFDVPTLIATLSAVMTLQPGDIIATGTPAGVGLGFDPPKFLQSADRVKVAISKLGTMENPVA